MRELSEDAIEEETRNCEDTATPIRMVFGSEQRGRVAQNPSYLPGSTQTIAAKPLQRHTQNQGKRFFLYQRHCCCHQISGVTRCAGAQGQGSLTAPPLNIFTTCFRPWPKNLILIPQNLWWTVLFILLLRATCACASAKPITPPYTQFSPPHCAILLRILSR